MAAVLEYKCPACGGAVAFDADSQNIKCPYCDSEFELESLKAMDEVLDQDPQEDMSWNTDAQSQWQEEEEQQLRNFVCNSCGGEIMTEATTAATFCPYCGNPVVMQERLAGSLKPDLVIPFKLNKQDAKDALAKHLKGKVLLPKVFKSENYIEKIQGVYVPFWLFDADADADIRFKGTKISHWSDGNYNYTKTSHYRIYRSGTLGFSAVPVDGSSKMADDLMESIEPYDLSQAVDFQTAYLAGYLADKYDVEADDCKGRASDRIKTSTQAVFRNTVDGYNTVVTESSSVRLINSQVKYALMPVWLLNTTYRGQKYSFAMNGQTGKFVGNLPMNKAAYWLWWAGVTVLASGLYMAIAHFAF